MSTLARDDRLFASDHEAWAIKALLGCGIAYTLMYVVSNDVIAASLYAGYSRMSQAVSELSATSAPTRALLTAMVPLSVGLMSAFGIGVMKAAAGSRALRVTGAALVMHSATMAVWLFYPMTSRGDMVTGTGMPANDIGHIAMTGLTIAFILVELGAAAFAFGARFKVYSVVSALVVLGFGGLTGVESAKLAVGEPTPWLGLYERIGIGGWLVWFAVVAIAVSRRWTRLHAAT